MCWRKQGKVFTAKYPVTFPTGDPEELEQKITSACQGKVSFLRVGGFAPEAGGLQTSHRTRFREGLREVSLAD